VQAIGEQNIQVSARQLGQHPVDSDQNFQYRILAQGRLQSPEALAQIILRTTESEAIVRALDVGRVELGAENYDCSFRINRQKAVGIRVSKLEAAISLIQV